MDAAPYNQPNQTRACKFMDEEETGKRQIYKRFFLGFRASPAGTDRNWTSGVIRVFLIGGDGNDDGK